MFGTGHSTSTKLPRMTQASFKQDIAPPNLSLGKWLADLLKERLAAGIYLPGTWIREAALQREFGLSNGPVREALQTLVVDGLLERAPWRGVRVVELTDSEIVEVMELRLALLELAAELAAKRATSISLDEARRLLGEVDAAIAQGSPEALMPAGGMLSYWICVASGNTQLADAWTKLTLRSRMYIFRSLKHCDDLRRVRRLWRDLVRAIESRDPTAARSAVRSLVRRTLEDLGLKSSV